MNFKLFFIGSYSILSSFLHSSQYSSLLTSLQLSQQNQNTTASAGRLTHGLASHEFLSGDTIDTLSRTASVMSVEESSPLLIPLYTEPVMFTLLKEENAMLRKALQENREILSALESKFAQEKYQLDESRKKLQEQVRQLYAKLIKTNQELINEIYEKGTLIFEIVTLEVELQTSKMR